MTISLRTKTFLAQILVMTVIAGTLVYNHSTSGEASALEMTADQKEMELVLKQKLEKSWNAGKNKIIAHASDIPSFSELNSKQPLEDWAIMDMHNDLFQQFSMKEQSAFLDAYYNDERAQHMQIGDWMPALLVNPDQTEVIEFWEKKDGTYMMIHLKTKKEGWGKKVWYVYGGAVPLSDET
ncbi:hypothetical protein [Paenibacillus hubeiensis]|uniref:hypothetical protein n=1 Tax=Paenibacillus hubeiensis TaxID=3077330 RepID=UPI0031BA31BF